VERLTKDELQAFANLEENINFEIIIKYYQRQLEIQNKNNDYERDDISFRMVQGRNQIIRHLIQNAKDARELLNKQNKKRSESS